MLRQNAHCKSSIILQKWQTTGQKPCRVLVSAHVWQPLALMRTGHFLRWNTGLTFMKLIKVSQAVLITKGYQIMVQRNFEGCLRMSFCWCFERIWKWKIHNVTLHWIQVGFLEGEFNIKKRAIISAINILLKYSTTCSPIPCQVSSHDVSLLTKPLFTFTDLYCSPQQDHLDHSGDPLRE